MASSSKGMTDRDRALLEVARFLVERSKRRKGKGDGSNSSDGRKSGG